MNKSAIKGFSIRARRKLIEDITQKAFALGIKDTKVYEDIEEFEGGFRVKNAKTQIVYPREFKSHRDKLITEINRKGFEQVIEEVAYTWFNRIIAIRYMEINEYLPVKVRILSSETEGKVEPDVLTDVYDYIDELELDRDKVFDLKESHKDEELFKYIFIRECNKLGTLMPQVFEDICDFTELLLPDQLLSSGSVIRELIESIEEDDFKEEVEIIGWMYQYYISEKKDEVFAALKKNTKITKENIPAATQLFTPKWIVKYMTENSLGRLWQESHPNEELKKKWKYYIEPAEQEAEVQKKLDELKNPNLSPEEIKILDPAMGSGHILVYAFDVLYDIYLSRGYAERDIPQLILEKNLYGLDIDDRAAQLASFALLMKARSKNRRFFRKNVELNICSIHESNNFSNSALEYLVNPNDTQIEKIIHLDDAKYLIDVFKDAKEYGSILEIKAIDFDKLMDRIIDIGNGYNLNIFEYGYKNEICDSLPHLIKQGRIMSESFDVVVTNPPYMGRKGMNSQLSDYLDKHYKDSKNDMYAVFMESCIKSMKKNGLMGMINQHNWMFLTSYSNLRAKLIKNTEVQSMIHLGPRAFEEIGGEVVQSATFVLRNKVDSEFVSEFYRCVDAKTAQKKEELFLDVVSKNIESYQYIIKSNNFLKMAGFPIAYWIDSETLKCFDSEFSYKTEATPRKGLDTGGESILYFRKWYEVDYQKFYTDEAVSSDQYKWFEIDMGGEYRKWYGNRLNVINYENNGYAIKHKKKRPNIRNEELYFQDSITYGVISSSSVSFRRSYSTSIFYQHGANCFPPKNKINYFLAMGNSVVADHLLQYLAPTLTFTVGDIAKIPVLYTDENHLEQINLFAENCIEICKKDWDESELSFDFKSNKIVKLTSGNNEIVELVKDLQKIKFNQIQMLKQNEEDINKIFIRLYGLEKHLEHGVKSKSITLSEVNINSEVKSLISYAVGCMLGRFSVEKEGLTYAGGQFDPIKHSIFVPTDENILIISEEDYFENDIVCRLIDFVKVIFGKETLEDNLKYIAEVINPKSKTTARLTIRNYFVKDFYKDHLRMYKKYPIYWMIESGKKNGVKALFYMHRYDKSTIAKFRTDYLHEIQRAYENDIELNMNSNDGNAKKKVDELKKKLVEVNEFEKVVAHIAHQQIEFDLDDGVEHNYELFQGIEVPQGDGQKPIKRDLLAKRK